MTCCNHDIGEIGPGLCVLVGVTHADTAEQARKLAGKLWNLRIMDDEAGVMNRSVAETTGQVLIVSQFTLAADTTGGNRPSFSGAAPPALGRALYESVLRIARERHAPVPAGEFGADMQVELVNDGPVTLVIDSAER